MTIQDFIAGKPVNFKSFAGEDHVATFGTANGLGVPSLKIKNVRGKTVRHLIMGRAEAVSFFLNLDAVAS